MPKPRVTEKSREVLLKTAKKLFSQKGFDGVSVKELAQEAGVNISLISYHFGGKESLYRACVEQFGLARLQVVQKILQEPKNIEEFRVRLAMYIEEMIQCHAADPEATRLVQCESEANFPLIEDIFEKTFLQSFKTLQKFFQVAQKNGILKKEVQPLALGLIFFSSLMHLIKNAWILKRYLKLDLTNEKVKKNLIDQILILYVEGLST